MRKCSELISDVRFLTNENDVERFSDVRMLIILNLAQDYLESVLTNNFPENGPFIKEATITRGQDGTYSLPADMYSKRAITSIFYNDTKIDRISQLERSNESGYYVFANKLQLSFDSAEYDTLKIVYTKKLSRLTSPSSVSELPSCCEPYLIEYAEKKIASINSSSDFNTTSVFSDERLKSLVESFYPSEEINNIPIANINRILF